MVWLTELRKNCLVLTLVILYIGFNMLLTSQEFYLLNFLPVVLFLLYIAFIRLDAFYFLIIFLTPLSIQLIEFIRFSPLDFAIPTEPMLFGVMLLLVYKLLLHDRIDGRILNHPLSYAVYFYILWMSVTSLTSTMPLVSFKFLLAKLWFILTYYFLAATLFQQTSKIRSFIWTYTAGMIIVVIYTVTRHIHYGIDNKQIAHIVMSPFFRDHTSYGAILAMLLFSCGGMLWKNGKQLIEKLLHTGLILLLACALVLSYSRAAWVSAFVAGGILIIILLRIKARYVLLAGVLVGIYFFSNRTEIIESMQRNRQESSASITGHLRSISNIATDESNLERLNRWNSAIRMYRERPILGWGPGTYMFKYAPFQLSKEMTNISTNFGDLGNAHSEYLGPLSESGLPGALAFILIAIISIVTGFRNYYSLKNKKLKRLSMGIMLGLMTYFVHGFMNNFLDTDKASALFWGFIAALVAMDIKSRRRNEETKALIVKQED